jgi:hypothetical protein
MGREQNHTAQQIMKLLWQVEVGAANKKTLAQACREAAIAERTSAHWRHELVGLKLGHARRLKDLERENAKLRRLAANLSSS